MAASTTIIIPGREAQVISGLAMTAADVRAAYAGDIDLSNMNESTETSGEMTTITFANKTGTKGNDIIVNVNVDGDIVVNNTRIEIPGREAQTIPGLVMTPADVRAAFAGDVDLTGMNVQEAVDGDTQVITFANRTGTKGQTNLLSAIFAAVQEAETQQRATVDAEADNVEEYLANEYFEDTDETPELTSTRIVIPGREDQFIQGIVLDAQMVKDSFSGEIDLSGYNVEEIENGSTLEVRFSARTGTKGDA